MQKVSARVGAFACLIGFLASHAAYAQGRPKVYYDVDEARSQLLDLPDDFGAPSSRIEVQLRLCGDVTSAMRTFLANPSDEGIVVYFDAEDRLLSARRIDLRFRDRYSSNDPKDRKKPELTLKIRDVPSGQEDRVLRIGPDRRKDFQIKSELGLVRDAEGIAYRTVGEMGGASVLSVAYQPNKTWVSSQRVEALGKSIDDLAGTQAEAARCEAESFLFGIWPAEHREWLFREFGWKVLPNMIVERAYKLRSWEWVSSGPDALELTLEERTHSIPAAKKVYELSFKADVLNRFEGPERLLERLEAELPVGFQDHAWICDDQGRAIVTR